MREEWQGRWGGVREGQPLVPPPLKKKPSPNAIFTFLFPLSSTAWRNLRVSKPRQHAREETFITWRRHWCSQGKKDEDPRRVAGDGERKMGWDRRRHFWLALLPTDVCVCVCASPFLSWVYIEYNGCVNSCGCKDCNGWMRSNWDFESGGLEFVHMLAKSIFPLKQRTLFYCEKLQVSVSYCVYYVEWIRVQSIWLFIDLRLIL